jgi:tetratricopeptide (TPR) repeat protein
MTTSRSHVPSRPSASVLAAWCLAALVVAPAAALAGNKDDARAHIARATRAHKDGRYADARVELQAAYALDPRPDVLYALGQVNAKLGNCREAVDYYKRFAATQSDPQVARVVDQAIAACTALPAPEPAAVATGRAPSDAARAPSAPRVASPPVAPAPVAPAPAATDRAPWYRDTVGGALVGAGVIAAVVGLVEHRSALSDLDAAGDRGRTTTLDRFDELVAGAHQKRTMALVLAGAGGALIGAGVIRFVLHREPTEVRVGVAPARGGGVVSYAGSF